MMPDTLVQLDDIVFTGYEVPEKIPFGGEHRLTNHKLVGGARTIDRLGPDDRELTWGGRFQSSDASLRARRVDYLRRQGTQVILSWDAFVYLVIVQRFAPDFERFYQIPYEISCLVVQDLTNPVATTPQATIDDLVNGDLAAALAGAAALGIASITAAMQVAQTALNTAGLLGTASPALIQKAQNALSTAQNATTAALGIANGQVDAFGTLAAVTAGAAGLGNATALANAATAAVQVSQLAPIASFISRMNINLGQVGG